MSHLTIFEQRKALLQAVRVLTNHGHHQLAQQLWDTALTISDNNEQDSTLIALFNQAVRDTNHDSKEALIAHWKKLCDLLDTVAEE